MGKTDCYLPNVPCKNSLAEVVDASPGECTLVLQEKLNALQSGTAHDSTTQACFFVSIAVEELPWRVDLAKSLQSR